MFKRFKTLTVDVFRTSVDLTLQREVQVDLDTEGTAVSRTKRTRLGVSLGANVSFPSWTKGDNEESSGETEGKKKIDGHEDRSPGGKAEKAVTTGEAERKKIGANAEKPNKTGVAESTMDGHKERDGAPGGKTGEAESTIDGQERDGSPGGKAEKTEETQTRLGNKTSPERSHEPKYPVIYLSIASSNPAPSPIPVLHSSWWKTPRSPTWRPRRSCGRAPSRFHSRGSSRRSGPRRIPAWKTSRRR